MQVDFERERRWWDTKAPREERDRADEAINRALRWRELERHLDGVRTVLDVGGGTGVFSIPLARRGFEVTAVDFSPIAFERARSRAEEEDVLARFVLADVFEFALTAGQFDLVYDAGFYHFIRRADLHRYLDLLWRTTRPGSFYLALIGSVGEKAEDLAQFVPDDFVDALFEEMASAAGPS